MKEKKMKREIHFSDELNDDFAGMNIKRKNLPLSYKYIHTNPFWRFCEFVLYYILALPLVFISQKLAYNFRFVNKKVLDCYKKEGCFIYGNHTLTCGDAFTPSLLSFPKKAFIVTSPDAVSVPLTGTLVEMLGAMPLPTQFAGMRNFREAVDTRAKNGKCIVIYPEAHIWPYYTKIRPFKDVSFKYAAETNKPAFCFTTTYQKRRHCAKPKVTVYIDGPFYPDENLPIKENQKMLRNSVYEAMCKRSKNSDYEYYSYTRLPENTEENNNE
ncbi:MAG: 1-acyl-sn-glycerol-3-phosphate acyltransferase [Clostridia bacterium]|nr:1-acyl-sn-glycerol-3-phosphate acyltransferase [Clostridia bacterium]